jgi:pimeloyl-ACP methyl ester carboxylesterase
VEQQIQLPTGSVGVSTYGSGPPLVLLQRDVVAPIDSPYVAALAERHEVHVIDVPGFGRSPRPPWTRTVTHLATLVGQAMDVLDLDRPSLVGLGFGGWVAADLATQGDSRIGRLVLVSPWGVKPTAGEVTDFVLLSLTEWAALGFHDPENYTNTCGVDPEPDLLRNWDSARESVTAVAWKPIGHSRHLPPMLGFVQIPTLILWGGEDAIVPPSCAADWAAALPQATVKTLPNAGHQVDLEATSQLAEATLDFIRSDQSLQVS